ncbi:MAG: lipoyl(octanoyl) transferase LipB [Candidatus Nanopelagicaceae bacterium]
MSTTTSTLSIRQIGIVDYESAWDLQRDLHRKVAAGEIENTLLLLEHPPIFTAGRRTLDSERPIDGSKVIDVDRGGKITFHGPGQIVGYPIIKLREPENVVGFVREIELSLIDLCISLGIPAERYCERSGVWIRDKNGDRKIAAIGIRVAKGVTMHGFALNIDPDLSYFSRIIPCGIPDAGVTSISKELGREVSVAEIQPLLLERISEALKRVAI